ncbi:MAG: efflux RND transporter permease subunit [Oscillospiraceae bacterium]|nr:efflux RND transporter permease subunit [Oscillospiraceae bacterium]
MFSNFSVRKPFTVLVGVILIVVLGVISFMNTTTDLIPSMNLPYAVIITTYPGATPEQVEVEITAPIEGRVGIISGLNDISSISNEHFSVVFLEFVDSVNMDSVSLEIREALDMLVFPENAGRSSILRLNPDMMPVMVTTVFAENMNMGELSEFTKETVAPAFESVPGVASVSTSGLIQNQLYIIIDEEKIEQVNEKLRTAIVDMIEEMQAQGMAMFEEAVAAAVAEQVQNITAELMGQGLPLEQATAMAQEQIPVITEQVVAAMTAAMAENNDSENQPEFDISEIGIPAEMLTIDMVKNILSAQNFSMPAGIIGNGDDELTVRVGDRLRTADDVSSLLLFDPNIMLAAMLPPDMPQVVLETVRLSDVAVIIDTDNSETQYTRVNGNPAVMLTMQKQTEFSTADLTRQIRAKMDELSERHADLGLEFAVMMDQGNYIDIIIGSVLNNLIIGGILAIIILLLFLRDLRPTLIVGISIPVSLMLAFTAMYFTGVSLNIISMSGLALGVGMLVDNSIVVIENIYRLRSSGVPARRAAVQGAVEVSGAIFASTLTTIAVFLPIVFTGGLTRQLFTDLGLTIAYSLLASLLISLTVVPASSSAVFYRMKPKEHKVFDRFRDGYAKLLKKSLRIKPVVLLISVAAVVASALAVYSRGLEFIPAMDSEEIAVSVSLPDDMTFEDAVEAADDFTTHIKNIDGVAHVSVNVSAGGAGMMNMLGGMFGMGDTASGSGSYGMDIFLLLEEDRALSNFEIAEIIMQKDGVHGAEIDVTYNSQTEMNFLTGDSISINITGRELDDLRDTALEVAEIVRSVEGTLNIRDGSGRAAPELRITVDKDAAMRKGLTTAQVFFATFGAISDPEEKINMTLSSQPGLPSHDYEVIIKDSEWSEADRKAIENLEITTPTGEVVKITEVSEINDDTGFTSINRSNNARYLTVGGEIEEGYNVTLINDEIARKLQDYVPRDGCTVTVRGESEAINTAFNDLYLMLLLAVIFIYLIMVAQFQSLLSPFIVMFTIPLAFTGGFAALLIGGMRLSVVAMIGLVLLTGVVVNNGIVFVDCINRLRRYEGLSKKDAIVEAGRIRMRPIMMTALTTIVAMSTMTVGMGQGTEMVQPMAMTVVGGLIYATFMTLFVVPCMYDLLHRNRDMSKDEDLDYEKTERI